MHKNHRRAFLRNALKTSAFAAAYPAVSRILQGAAAAGNLSEVEHVVFFMQENRSFDHYCGTMSGVRGYADPHPPRLPDKSTSFGQRDSSGKVLYPFRLNSNTSNGQCVKDVDHSWRTGLSALHGGRSDNWIPAKGTNAIGYYTRDDIPYFYGLADAFTLCDHYHCSVNGPTNPNRIYMWTGTVDVNGAGGGPVTGNKEPGFSWTTYPERLQKAGVSWKVYQEVDNYDDNALAWFNQYRSAPASSPLWQNGMLSSPRTQFAEDVQNHVLPAVSWIIAPAALSEHPEYAPAMGHAYGAMYCLNALASNPAIWEKTIFVWMYDENGGFFDHVIPPTPPVGTPEEFVGGNPVGMGSRIPALVISPWSRGGWANSEVFDHTSLLRLLEIWTGIKEPNINAWRRKVAGDLTSCFDFHSPQTIFPSLPDFAAAATLATQNCASLPAGAPNREASPPGQEPGSRPQRAVPYQLNAQFQDSAILLQNTGTQAAAVSLHYFTNGDALPAHVTVEAGGSERSALPHSGNVYEVEVHGPNGFFRRFAGTLSKTEKQSEVAITLDPATSQVHAQISNTSSVSMRVAVASSMSALSSYQKTVSVEPGSSAQVSLGTVDHWYDYSFSHGEWVRQIAGHLEGQPSRTRTT